MARDRFGMARLHYEARRPGVAPRSWPRLVGKPDPARRSIVKAYVALVPGREGSPELAGELQAHRREVTAAYKYPREVEFVTDLPKTISGTIRRVELRERAAAEPRSAVDRRASLLGTTGALAGSS